LEISLEGSVGNFPVEKRELNESYLNGLKIKTNVKQKIYTPPLERNIKGINLEVSRRNSRDNGTNGAEKYACVNHCRKTMR
jgi:hypothetical protein